MNRRHQCIALTESRYRGKEIIGGYILFPGRTEGMSIENRYFYRSIKKVNIGAFTLLPALAENKENVVSCDLLEKHLREILLEDSEYEHIKDSIPQKGLLYEDANVNYLMVAASKDVGNDLNALKNGSSTTFRFGQSGPNQRVDLFKIKYLVPIIENRFTGHYEIESIKFNNKEGILEIELGEYKSLENTVLIDSVNEAFVGGGVMKASLFMDYCQKHFEKM